MRVHWYCASESFVYQYNRWKKSFEDMIQKSREILPEIENDVVIAARHNIFVKYVTSILEDPCSNTLSWKFGKKASATTLMQTSPIPEATYNSKFWDFEKNQINPKKLDICSHKIQDSTIKSYLSFKCHKDVPTKSKFGETWKSAAAKKTIPREIMDPKKNSKPCTFFLLYTTAIIIVGIN